MRRETKEKAPWAGMLGLVAVLLAAALPAPASASEPSPTYAETRVWAFELQIAAGVGAERGLNQTSTEAYAAPYDEVAVGYPLVPRGSLLSSGELAGIERASPRLLGAVGRRRAITFAEEGTDALRFLEYRGAEAAAFGETDILLRANPSKAAVLEEFLHGTQQRLGIIDRVGRTGAESHVKSFMIRHRRLLGLGSEDVEILRRLKEFGL